MKFQIGTCTLGDSCTREHVILGEPATAAVQAELREQKQARKESGDKMACFNFQNNGKCSYGDDCRFEHVAPRTIAKMHRRVQAPESARPGDFVLLTTGKLRGELCQVHSANPKDPTRMRMALCLGPESDPGTEQWKNQPGERHRRFVI